MAKRKVTKGQTMIY